MRRLAADDAAQRDERVVFLLSAMALSASGISNAPGTRTTSIFALSAPWRVSASSAPSSRRSLMKLLKRATVMPKRVPRAVRSPSMFFTSVMPLPLSLSGFSTAVPDTSSSILESCPVF